MTQGVLPGHDIVHSRQARELHNGNLMLESYLRWRSDAHLMIGCSAKCQCKALRATYLKGRLSKSERVTTGKIHHSSNVANARGRVHLQLAIAFAQEIFNTGVVLSAKMEVLLKLRSESVLVRHPELTGTTVIRTYRANFLKLGLDS